MAYFSDPIKAKEASVKAIQSLKDSGKFEEHQKNAGKSWSAERRKAQADRMRQVSKLRWRDKDAR